jgi:hypothetical protein
MWYCLALSELDSSADLQISGFGGLVVPKIAGSNPAEAVGFFGRKIPQHAFLRKGSKAVCPIVMYRGQRKAGRKDMTAVFTL